MAATETRERAFAVPFFARQAKPEHVHHGRSLERLHARQMTQARAAPIRADSQESAHLVPPILFTIANAEHSSIFLNQLFDSRAHRQLKVRIFLRFSSDEFEEVNLWNESYEGKLGFQASQVSYLDRSVWRHEIEGLNFRVA